METQSLTTREAAKGILYTPDRRIVVVAGKRGMFNLPGGGLDANETPRDALYREVYEELGVTENDLSDVQAIGGTWGVITPEHGETKRAVWHLFEGTLQVSTDELQYSNEITAVDSLSATEILNHPNMSQLARQAVLHTMYTSKDESER